MINFNENCNKERESRRAIDRKKSRKMRPGNQYALCLGAQLNGRGSLPAIFFDQRLLGFFSLIPWGVTGWFCGLKGPPETNAAMYALFPSPRDTARLSLKIGLIIHILLSRPLCPFVSLFLLSSLRFFTDEQLIHLLEILPCERPFTVQPLLTIRQRIPLAAHAFVMYKIFLIWISIYRLDNTSIFLDLISIL